ncbi:hypothetical protein AOQ84DRAFT_351952 [Glonium stellatum]|uniref:Uncharacterized protein n=1 Tax=Glonium stellatum TaxID=574774 RepID=A0A8E2FAD1_9PEZI|nr:hypothetical protein AOQ84DRAFT_351952 [Glonium stellatum]
MPRPKRAKVASTRVAQPLQPSTVASHRHNPARQASERLEVLSDDSEGLITTTRTRRRPSLASQQDTGYTMTGGLGEGDVKGAHKTLPKTRPTAKKVKPSERQTEALDALKRRRDATLKTKASRVRELSPEPTIPSSQLKGSQLETTTKDAREPSPVPSEVDSLYASPSPPRTTNRQSTLKAQGTPAMDISILALTNFKRRPRQPSILRMVRQTSDNEDDFDDFNPDDESTPLNLHKNAEQEGVDKGTGRRSSTSTHTSSSRKRKLSSPNIQVPRSSPPAMPSPTEGRGGSIPPSEPSSLPEHIAETQEDSFQEQQQQGPEIWSETMAPPKSSSSLSNSPVVVKASKTNGERKGRPRRSRKTRQVQDEDDKSDEDSVDSGAESVAIVRRKNATPKRPSRPPNLSTAKLQSMLPRRRHRAKGRAIDQFDIPSSDDVGTSILASDEDELQLPASRHTTNARRTDATRTPVKRTSREAKKNTGQTSAKKATPVKSTPTAKGVTRTYGNRRVTSSDKENESTFIHHELSEEDDEPTEVTIDHVKSAELAAAAKKFAEVDQWEMEFESVDIGGESSSPWR